MILRNTLKISLGSIIFALCISTGYGHSQLAGESLKTHHFHSSNTQLIPEVTDIPLETESNQDWEFALQVGWSSKYISEGIDVFDGGGVWEIAPEIRYKEFSFLTWYGLSDKYKNTSELKFIGTYDFALSDQWMISPSYEHCIAQPGTESTDVIALTLCYEANDWLTFGTDIQSDITGKHGEYFDVFCELQFPLWEGTTGTLCCLYAWNEGFLGEGYLRGSNTLDYTFSIETELTENLTQIISINYSQALTALQHFRGNEDDETLGKKLGNEFWCGYYLRYSF